MSRDFGALWHALAGFVLAAAASFAGGTVPGAIAVGALLGFGLAREWWQHDRTLSRRQWLEALAWPAGGMLGLWLA